jgi:hypothetical protein
LFLIKYCAGDKIKKNELCGACSVYGGEKRRGQGFGGKREGKRPLGTHRGSWDDNIKMDFQEVVCENMEWIELAQDRDTFECGNEPSDSIKCGEFLD